MGTLSSDDMQRAEEEAMQVLLDTFGDFELIEYPVDLRTILDKYALLLKNGSFEDPNISGAFSRDEDTIYVSENESTERQAFTIAHEIGHYRMHEARKTDILYRKQIWQFTDGDLEKDETMANLFAANLLMPKEAVERMWLVTQDVEKLSSFFGVSKVAIGYRLKDLGLVG